MNVGKKYRIMCEFDNITGPVCFHSCFSQLFILPHLAPYGSLTIDQENKDLSQPCEGDPKFKFPSLTITAKWDKDETNRQREGQIERDTLKTNTSLQYVCCWLPSRFFSLEMYSNSSKFIIH